MSMHLSSRLRLFVRVLLLASCFSTSTAFAVTFTVASEQELRDAITQINSEPQGTHFIVFSSDIELAGTPLPPVTNGVVIQGNGRTLSSGSGERLLVLESSQGRTFVQINNLTLNGGSVMGSGADGGGAILVNPGADVVVNNVTIGGNDVANGVGGAIFVAEGGTVSLAGKTSIAGNSASEGGDGIFLEGSGTLQLRGPGAGSTLTISDGISDAVGAGLPGANSYDRWNLYLTGDSLEGRVELLGDNTFSGDTTITNTTLAVVRDENLGGTQGQIILDYGGLGLGHGFNLERDIYVSSGGAFLGVDAGAEASIDAAIQGVSNTFIEKRGEGTLAILRDTGFEGTWFSKEGYLAISEDGMLGDPTKANLILNGGGLKLTDSIAQGDAVRSFLLSTDVEEFSRVDNSGHTVYLTGIDGAGSLAFTGAGDTHLVDTALYAGNTLVEQGRLFASFGVGPLALGSMEVSAGATWNLDGRDSAVRDLQGAGTVALDARTLHLSSTPPEPGEEAVPVWFGGSFENSGVINVTSGSAIGFSGNNQGSTADLNLYNNSRLWIASENSLTAGALNFHGGALHLQSGGTYNSAANLVGNGIINIGEAGGTPVIWAGQIGGAGSLRIEGAGEIALTNNGNNYLNTTLANGAWLQYGLNTQLGSGSLSLESSEGAWGGIRVIENIGTLGPIRLAGDGGAIDTGTYDVEASSVSASAACIPMLTCAGLEKYGSGTLTLANASYGGLTNVHAGSLRLVNSTAGAFSSPVNLASNTSLIFQQNANGAFGGAIMGSGDVIKRGAGELTLQSSLSCLLGICTNFTGDLRIEEGLVYYSSPEVLGMGQVILDGGGLRMGADLNQSVFVQSNGSLAVNSGTRYMNGNIEGPGSLSKLGNGTLIFHGHADFAGGSSLTVEAGKFQVGSGYAGTVVGDIVVDAGAAIGFGRDDITLYSGAISGAGDLYKTGDSASGLPPEFSTLILTGDHTYTGTTRVEYGQLQIGMGGTSGSLQSDIEVVAGTGVTFDRSDSSQYDGAISGSGQLELKTGTFIFTGDSSAFAGGTLVQSGSFLLDGQLGGNLLTGSGSVFGGRGSLHGLLDMSAGGQLAIGNPATGSDFGTLQVEDAFFGPLMTWRLDIDDSGNRDKLEASGNVIVDRARIDIQAASGSYTSGVTYRILEAASVGCIPDCSSSGFSLSNNLAFLTPSLNYGADFIDLTMTRNTALPSSFALTRNQKAVAGALEVLETSNPSHDVWQYVETLVEADLPDTYNQLSGDALLAAQAASQKAVSAFSRQLQLRTSRLGTASRGKQVTEGAPENLVSLLQDDYHRELRLAQWTDSLNVKQQAAPSPVKKVEGFWVQAQQLQIDEKSDSDMGNAAYEVSGPMLALGFDGYWGNNLILGLGVGTFDGSLSFSNRQAEGDLSSTFLGAYGRYDWTSLHLKTGFTLAQNSAETKRQVSGSTGSQQARSDVDSTLWALQMELGYGSQWGAFGARPFLRVQHQHQSRDGFAEQGAGGQGALVVASSAQSGGEWGVGVEVSRPLLLTGPRWAQVQASLALLNPYGDYQATQKAHFQGAATPIFQVSSAPEDDWITEYSLGGEYYFSKKSALWLGLQGRDSANGSELHGLIGFSVRW